MKTSEEHYQEFLSRIPTREAFRAEMIGKLNAVIGDGYPLPISKENIMELVAILPMDTLGDPQVWPKL